MYSLVTIVSARSTVWCGYVLSQCIYIVLHVQIELACVVFMSTRNATHQLQVKVDAVGLVICTQLPFVFILTFIRLYMYWPVSKEN
jgi:hypothetical protein